MNAMEKMEEIIVIQMQNVSILHQVFVANANLVFLEMVLIVLVFFFLFSFFSFFLLIFLIFLIFLNQINETN